jgi:hypothetical protein
MVYLCPKGTALGSYPLRISFNYPNFQSSPAPSVEPFLEKPAGAEANHATSRDQSPRRSATLRYELQDPVGPGERGPYHVAGRIVLRRGLAQSQSPARFRHRSGLAAHSRKRIRTRQHDEWDAACYFNGSIGNGLVPSCRRRQSSLSSPSCNRAQSSTSRFCRAGSEPAIMFTGSTLKIPTES